MVKRATAVCLGGALLVFGGYVVRAEESGIDLRVTIAEVEGHRGVRVTNVGENPISIQEIIYNDGRCKQPPLPTPEMCEENFKKGDLAKGGSMLNMDQNDYTTRMDCALGYTYDYNGVFQPKKGKFPAMLREGDTIENFPWLGKEAGCANMEIVRVRIVTDHGTATYTWK